MDSNTYTHALSLGAVAKYYLSPVDFQLALVDDDDMP